MNYEVRLTQTATQMLLAISEPAIRQRVVERISRLSANPETQGGHLKGALSRYRKCRAANRRCRILFRINDLNSIVTVEAIGIRNPGEPNDIYEIVGRLLREGLLE